MENNESTTEETVDTSSEDVKDETTQESVEDTKDWKAEALKYKAIAERKEKKLQQSTQATEETTINKPNTEPSEDFQNELRMIASGVSETEIANLKTIAKGKGITMAEAREDPMFKLLKEQGEQAAEKQTAQLGASAGGATAPTTASGDEAVNKKHKEMLAKFNK